jgi:hypothetical protein
LGHVSSNALFGNKGRANRPAVIDQHVKLHVREHSIQ